MYPNDMAATVPTDVVAPNGARPSTGSVMSEELSMFSGFQRYGINFVDRLMSFKMAVEIQRNLAALWVLMCQELNIMM